MTTEPAPPFEHPLRSKDNVPRSDVRRVTAGVAEALDRLLATDAPAASGAGGAASSPDSPAKAAVVRELLRCVGGRVKITSVAVGDLLVQVVCEDEAGAAAVAAVVNHAGFSGKASWFKGDDDGPWVVLIIPAR